MAQVWQEFGKAWCLGDHVTLQGAVRQSGVYPNDIQTEIKPRHLSTISYKSSLDWATVSCSASLLLRCDAEPKRTTVSSKSRFMGQKQCGF